MSPSATAPWVRPAVFGTIFWALTVMLSWTTGVNAQMDKKASTDWERQLEQLRSVPYVDFSPDVSLPNQAGVIQHIPESAWQGYNFYTSRSDGRVYLFDMSGHPVHFWNYLPGAGSSSDLAVFLANGDILLLKKHDQLIRMDWSSGIVWERRMRVHHDLALATDGTLYIIVRDWETYRSMRVWFDAILHLTEDGQELDRWHTFDRLGELKAALDTRSFLDTVLDSALGGRPDRGVEATTARMEVADRQYNFDYFHLNTVMLLPATPLGQRDDRFKEGNLLICLRNVNQIAVLDGQTYDILWSWGQGQLEWPHHPTMLSDGHILVFDNGVQRGYSRVIELDPVGEDIVWEYRGDPPDAFYSNARGAAQRLPNGNTLITESDRGRVFEVTRAGQVVWTWSNPAGEGDHRQTVYRMIRLPAEMVEPLLHRWWWWDVGGE